MKAEHRKELQTNSLADFLGNLLQRGKSSSGIPWFWIFLVLFVVVGVLLYRVWSNAQLRNNADAWANVEFNDAARLSELIRESPETRQGKAARLTLGYAVLWRGLQALGKGTDGIGSAFQDLNNAEKFFGEMEEECKDEPESLAEAKYHRAVAFEALAGIISVEYLKEARRNFEALSTGDLAKTPYGVLAAKRLEKYNDPTQFANLIIFYSNFRSQSPTLSGQ